MFGKYEIKRNKGGKFYFVLKASNGKIIARSEAYETKQGAQNGIRSVRIHAPLSGVDDLSLL